MGEVGDTDQRFSSGSSGGENTPPKAVVLLSAWNAEAFIERTLTSLAEQTWPNLEILVSVDLCADRTADICRSYEKNDPRFRVEVSSERLGWIANVNRLFAAADGDSWHLANHDDLLQPAHLETLINLLEERPSAVLAYPDVRAHYGEGRIVDRIYTELDGLADPAARARSILRREGEWYNANHSVFRADAARRVGGLRAHRGGEFSADWPWIMRMALEGELVRAPHVLCDKHYKKNSLSLTWRRNLREELGALEDCARAVAGSRIPALQKTYLSAVAGRELIRECRRAFRTWTA